MVNEIGMRGAKWLINTVAELVEAWLLLLLVIIAGADIHPLAP